MDDATQILGQIESGDPFAAEKLLPLIYDELRNLAAARLAQEKPGQSLQATALVHDAYIRLVDVDKAQHWDSRGHFFSAAAEAMRRILIEQARRKLAAKAGGRRERQELNDLPNVADIASNDRLDLLALDEALQKLEGHSPRKAQLVKLRFFAGLTLEEAAKVLGVAVSTASADWLYSKGWLQLEMRSDD